MARNLDELRLRYNSRGKDDKGRPPMPGPMGGPPRGRGGPRMSGKPKELRKTVKRLLSYVGKYKFRLILVLVCMLLTAVSSLIGGFMIAPIINKLTLELFPNMPLSPSAAEVMIDGLITRATEIPILEGIMQNKGQRISLYVFSALAILALVYLVSVVCSYLQSRIMLSVSQGSILAIRNDLFDKLQELPLRYFDSNPTGEVMSRFTNDIDNIDVMLNNSLTSIVSGVVTLVGTFTFMITTNVWLTLVTVLFIPVFIKGGAMIAKRSSKHYVSQQAAIGALNGYIEESISGQKVVKVFNHESECVEEFTLLNEDLRDKQFYAQFFGGIMGPVMGNMSQVSYGITVGLGGILMFTSGLTPGALTVFATYSRQFSMPINMISNQMSTIFAALAGAERVFKVMDATPESDLGELIDDDGIVGDVVFDGVNFGYVPEKTVLKNISLYAHPGQKIAFVGSTGAGKTTVTNLLNRFYDIEEGRITIDGRDIKEYTKDFLRKNIAMVLQDTHLFTGTVMENIRYGRLDATDEEVIAAAKTASAHSFIMRLEHGYDTVLTGDGANLSQGQRQLLNIARAALSNAPILVLDEATSSVDTRTERHIEHGMDRLMKNRTTFVIAHRLSTVRNANAIMVLEAGEIIERGTHDDLLKLEGRYYELYTGKKELD